MKTGRRDGATGCAGCAGCGPLLIESVDPLSVSAKTGRRDGATGCGVTGCGAYELPAPTFSLGLGVGAILFNSPLTSPSPPASWMMWSSIRA